MADQTHLAESDAEALSAYIDNQLSASERSALEARLARKPALREALAELQTTVQFLRELEPVRPPRSFTLDAAQVAPRPSIWSAAALWMRFGSLAAVVLLAVFLTGDLFSMNGFGSGASAASAPVMSTKDTAGGEAPEARSMPQAAAPTIFAAEAPAAAESSLMQATAQPAADAAAADSSLESAPADEGPLGATKAVTSSDSTAPDTIDLSTYQAEAPVEQPSDPWLLVKISLAGLAVLLLLGSFWAARRR